MSKQNNEENDWDDDWSFDKLKDKKELDWSEQQLAKKDANWRSNLVKNCFIFVFILL